MKLSLILLLITCFQVSAYTHAYGQNISLRKTNVPLEEVLKDIQKQSGYHIFYDVNLIDKAPRVSLQLDEATLKEALYETLKNLNLGYEEVNKNIIIKTLDKSNKSIKMTQQKSVTGKVTDENGIPLLGVTVAVKGKPQIGTTTDGNGVYALLNLPENATLVYRYIGYLEQEVSVGNQSSIDVSLLIDQAGLEEVVVVGFGQQKKESVVASVATIKGEQLRMPNRSLSNNLAGQLPGLIAVQRSGEPGYDNAEFWIRGVSSFAGGTNPLVLVDGVPRDMNDIEPDEIETFTLLKDAAATSVYGSEGANGVILITSKRGRVQKTSISYRGEASRLSPTRIPKFANSFNFLSLYNEAERNDGNSEIYSQELLAKYALGEDPDLYPSVDWWGTLMRDHTTNTRHTLNFRGGGDRMKYFVSGAYFGESGLYKVNNEYNNNAGLKRYNLRSNVDIDITKSTILKVDISGQYLQTNYPRQDTYGLIRWFVHAPPFATPAVYSDGTLAGTSGTSNPYNLLMEQGYRKEWRAAIQSKIDLEQRLDVITQGLKVRGLVSYDANSVYFMTRRKDPGTFYANGRDNEGKLIFTRVTNETSLGDPIESSSGDKNIYLETALNYDRIFDRHVVGGMFLYYQKEHQKHNEALAFRKQAWVGRSTYAFDNRYVLEANFSVTGSEQFAEGYRYGFFPAVGLAWNVMNESFFPESVKSTVSSLKLRASMGRTGNDQTGAARFLYRPEIVSGTGYNWGIGSTGPTTGVGSSFIEGRFESPALSWEIELKRNVGIDLSLFHGKIDIQADYFNNERSNILLQRRTISGVAGFRQAPWVNFGIVNNQGMDGSLNVHHRLGEVDFSARGNFTFARNKILEYDEIPQLYSWMHTTGTRLLALPGLVAERLFRDDDFNIFTDASGKNTYVLRDGIPYYEDHPNPKPGDIKYVDQNGDGVVDNNLDVVKDYKQPTVPEIMYGFGLNADYKGFYGNVFFQGAGNVSINLNNQPVFFQPFQEGVLRSSVRQEIVDSRWTEENPSQNVFFPRLSNENKANTTSTINTWWYRDASFLRLKNVEMGYSFDKRMISKIKMNGVRVYVMGQNIALWDKVKIFDPEMGNSGAGTAYPLPSFWTFGLDITF